MRLEKLAGYNDSINYKRSDDSYRKTPQKISQSDQLETIVDDVSEGRNNSDKQSTTCISEVKSTKFNTKSSKKNVHILSDSIFKDTTGYEFSKKLKNCYVNVKSVSGAKTLCMMDYANPSLRDNPDHFVLHVGTNNLSSQDPENIANDVINVAHKLKNEKHDVTVSSLIVRSDKFKEKVKKVNALLEVLCANNNMHFLDHSNTISEKHLNKSKVHLNKIGSKILIDNVFDNDFILMFKY